MKTNIIRMALAAGLAALALAVQAQPYPTTVSGDITTRNLVPTGVATANSSVEIVTVGKGSVAVQATNTWTGTLSAYCTLDGATWVLNAWTPITANGISTVNSLGCVKVRVAASAAVTGTASLILHAEPSAPVGAAGGGGAGDASAANQVTGNTSLASIDTKTPALGQAVAGSSSPVVLPAAQITTLTPPAAITGFATSANQTTELAQTGPTNETAAASNSATSGLNGLWKRFLNFFTSTASTDTNRLPVSLPDNLSGSATCSATCNTTNSGVMFSSQWAGYNSAEVYVTSVGGGVTLQFEYSDDSTTGVDGTWSGIAGTNPTSTASTPATAYTATAATGGSKFGRSGKWFRVRSSAYTSGTITFYYTLSSAPVPGVIVAAISNSVVVQGNGAHAGAVASANFGVLCDARTAAPTVVSTGQYVRCLATPEGKVIVLPLAFPEMTWNYAAASGGETGTGDLTIAAAPAAGLRNYLRSCSIQNSSATVGTEVVFKDGSTVLKRYYVGIGSLLNSVVNVNIDPPLRQPSTATALTAANITTGSAVYWNCNGYQAP